MKVIKKIIHLIQISLLFYVENLPYCPPVVEPELRHWYAVEVTHVKSPGEFYVRYPFGIDTSLGQGKERMYSFEYS